MPQTIKISTAEAEELKKNLTEKTDAESKRMLRFLNMPDLSRTEGNPLYEIVQRVLAWPSFKNFDVIEVPEIVSTEMTFDLFDFPENHPARSESDTYFLDKNHILRTHTTIMW